MAAGATAGATAGTTGVVTVVRTGASFNITWTIDNESVTGVGILMGELLAVGFYDDGKDAVAVYRHEADGSWTGQWVAAGDTALSPETWKPQR